MRAVSATADEFGRPKDRKPLLPPKSTPIALEIRLPLATTSKPGRVSRWW